MLLRNGKCPSTFSKMRGASASVLEASRKTACVATLPRCAHQWPRASDLERQFPLSFSSAEGPAESDVKSTARCNHQHRLLPDTLDMESPCYCPQLR